MTRTAKQLAAGSLILAAMFCGTARAQTRPTLSLVPVSGNRISPGGVVEVEVEINDVVDPNFLRGYQTTLRIVPLAGATGSLTLANVSTPIFADESDPDFVFAGSQVISDANTTFLSMFVTLFNFEESREVTTPKYCGTYLFQASPDANGDFRIEFVHPDDEDSDNTFLIHRDNVEQVIPFDPFPTTITVAIQPENDDCQTPMTVTDGATPFSTDNTTTDGPALPITCDEGAGTALEHDVWFDYTASCTGSLTVSTCNDADFDTRLAVYGSGTASCSCPIDNSTLLACDDNTSGCAIGTSTVSLNVDQGDCFKIRVGGAAVGATGTGSLTVTCVGNDTCASSRTLTVPSTTQGATLGATVDSGLPACGPAFDTPGVWYTVTGTGGLMTASLCSAASYDTRMTVFQGACGALTCVADANDTCGNRESISWCSVSGATYRILVSGVGGATGTFTLNTSSDSCNDNNACTADSCSNAQCVHTPNFDSTVSCCTPSTGALCTIDDGNPCTDDSCNASTGACIHSPGADGPEPACDDGLTCTFDRCLSGSCANTDINTITCTSDANCPNENLCDTDAGFCVCVPAPTVELVADPGLLPEPNCYDPAVGETIQVRVEMGFAPPQDPIVGAQLFLSYDPVTLDFIRMEPGSTVDPDSPFTLELNEVVDEGIGTIDYQVLVDFGEPGTANASTLAVATFQAVAECEPFVFFRPSGPNGEPNRLAAEGGVDVVPDELIDLPLISTNGTAPVLSGCPSDIITGADPGSFGAAVSWPIPTATDSCDGDILVTCTPTSGSQFPIGTTPVTCQAANSCGVSSSCSFNVIVQPSTLTVDVQLSPAMAAGPFDRCITLDLWDCDATGPERHMTVEENVTFSSGLATGVTIPIPGGQWECLTVRDRLHTLRSTAPDFATSDGVNYTATVTGDRATGGHWLLSGNLNDDQFIDILDFAVFLNEFLSPSDPNTVCGTPSPDANINGDNVVDLVDFVFVQVNSFQAHEPGCCGTGTGGTASQAGPVTEISVRDLRRMGLYHLRFADLNGDGILDPADIEAFLSGERPAETYRLSRPKSARPDPRRRSNRNAQP